MHERQKEKCNFLLTGAALLRGVGFCSKGGRDVAEGAKTADPARVGFPFGGASDFAGRFTAVVGIPGALRALETLLLGSAWGWA